MSGTAEWSGDVAKGSLTVLLPTVFSLLPALGLMPRHYVLCRMDIFNNSSGDNDASRSE